MSLLNLIKLARLTNKEIAVLDYFRIDNTVDKYNGDFTLSLNAKDGYEDYSFEELDSMAKSEGVYKWKNIIAFVLNVDLTAQKYYYQTMTLIYRYQYSKYIDKQNNEIKESYFKFLVNTFLAIVLNGFFHNLININSIDLLKTIPLVEQEPKQLCFLLRNEYLNRKELIDLSVENTCKEISEYVKEDEFISINFILSVIKDTNIFFKRLLRLLDFNTNSDTIGLKR